MWNDLSRKEGTPNTWDQTIPKAEKDTLSTTGSLRASNWVEIISVLTSANHCGGNSDQS
jgi:hypothetical protein